MAFQPRHKCGFGINEVVEVVPGEVGSEGSPIRYTFTVDGKPVESVLRLQDGPFIPAAPPPPVNADESGHAPSGTPPTANGITPEAGLTAICDHLESLAANTAAPELSQAFDHARRAIEHLKEYRKRTELSEPVDDVAAVGATFTVGTTGAGQHTIDSSPAGNPEGLSELQPAAPAEPQSHTLADPVPPVQRPPVPTPTDPALEAMRRLTRRSFATGAIAALTGAAGWGWLRTRLDDHGIPWPLRRVLDLNQKLAEEYFRPARLARTFPTSIARMPRANGHVGLDGDFNPENWFLGVGNSASTKLLQVGLEEIKALPRVEMVTELKCIEGWSDPVRWTGARLADLAARFDIATRSGRQLALERAASDLYPYVMLSTPDNAYYVGLDVASALHPQTLLCYEMNGEPLTPPHGAPLRLVIPVKYGIKNLKRIGTIRFTDERPPDYWAERGYDWYAGH
jgi:hypothetical protein